SGTFNAEVMNGPTSTAFQRASAQSFSPALPQWPNLPPSRPGSGGRTFGLGGSCCGGGGACLSSVAPRPGAEEGPVHLLPGRKVAFSRRSSGGSKPSCGRRAAQVDPRRRRAPDLRIDSAEWPSTVWKTRAFSTSYAHAIGSSCPVTLDLAVASGSIGSVPACSK